MLCGPVPCRASAMLCRASASAPPAGPPCLQGLREHAVSAVLRRRVPEKGRARPRVAERLRAELHGAHSACAYRYPFRSLQRTRLAAVRIALCDALYVRANAPAAAESVGPSAQRRHCMAGARTNAEAAPFRAGGALVGTHVAGTRRGHSAPCRSSSMGCVPLLQLSVPFLQSSVPLSQLSVPFLPFIGTLIAVYRYPHYGLRYAAAHPCCSHEHRLLRPISALIAVSTRVSTRLGSGTQVKRPPEPCRSVEHQTPRGTDNCNRGTDNCNRGTDNRNR